MCVHICNKTSSPLPNAYLHQLETLNGLWILREGCRCLSLVVPFCLHARAAELLHRLRKVSRMRTPTEKTYFFCGCRFLCAGPEGCSFIAVQPITQDAKEGGLQFGDYRVD